MSSVSKKMMQAAAGAGGAAEALAIEDVFSTYLYTGNLTARSITNGIDLAGEGGLVWIKERAPGTGNHYLFDTERGASYNLRTNETNSNQSTTWFTSFNSDGFSVSANSVLNNTNDYLASWTFRKAPRFFDVVTYTGDGTSDRQIAHSLNTTVGSVIIKETSGAKNWGVWHRSFGYVGDHMYLNTTGAVVNNTVVFGSTLPTETNFNVGAFLNSNGATYVAYLFAHDPLGPSGDGSDGLIACGSYEEVTGANTEVTLGWEPQFVIKKAVDTAGDWVIHDSMRGIATGRDDARLRANDTSAENSSSDRIDLTSTGFINKPEFGAGTIIYIAIRRGPMRVPESGTEVFEPVARSGTGSSTTQSLSFSPDFIYTIPRNAAGNNWQAMDRLRGGDVGLRFNSTSQEFSGTGLFISGSNVSSNEVYYASNAQNQSGTNYLLHSFKRAPNFFDVVTYTGDGTTGNVISHNLGVTPACIILKPRDTASFNDWRVWHKDLSGQSYQLKLNTTDAEANVGSFISQNDTTFTVGYTGANQSGINYVAYLFATLPGVSKVGSYTGNGTSQTIDCGFTTGARFVLIKRTDASGTQWSVFDSARGIVVGADPVLELDSTAAEVTTRDDIDPDNSGFIVNQDSSFLNTSGGNYIFLAIA